MSTQKENKCKNQSRTSLPLPSADSDPLSNSIPHASYINNSRTHKRRGLSKDLTAKKSTYDKERPHGHTKKMQDAPTFRPITERTRVPVRVPGELSDARRPVLQRQKSDIAVSVESKANTIHIYLRVRNEVREKRFYHGMCRIFLKDGMADYSQ